jgi:hypothetical protein
MVRICREACPLRMKEPTPFRIRAKKPKLYINWLILTVTEPIKTLYTFFEKKTIVVKNKYFEIPPNREVFVEIFF